MQSVYSTTPADWAILERCCNLQVMAVYILETSIKQGLAELSHAFGTDIKKDEPT